MSAPLFSGVRVRVNDGVWAWARGEPRTARARKSERDIFLFLVKRGRRGQLKWSWWDESVGLLYEFVG